MAITKMDMRNLVVTEEPRNDVIVETIHAFASPGRYLKRIVASAAVAGTPRASSVEISTPKLIWMKRRSSKTVNTRSNTLATDVGTGVRRMGIGWCGSSSL